MRFTSVFWCVLAVLAAALLYSVKYQVQAMDAEVAALHRQIDNERDSLQVLQAEWAFLSRPDRIRQLADKHLDMVPVGGAQLLDVADLGAMGDSDVLLADADGDSSVQQKLKPGVIQAGGVGYER